MVSLVETDLRVPSILILNHSSNDNVYFTRQKKITKKKVIKNRFCSPKGAYYKKGNQESVLLAKRSLLGNKESDLLAKRSLLEGRESRICSARQNERTTRNEIKNRFQRQDRRVVIYVSKKRNEF